MSRRFLFIMFSIFLAALLPAVAVAQEVHSTGLRFMDAEGYQSLPYAPRPVMGQLPERFDLSPQFPEPGNQGRQGSCVGWALSYLKAFQEISERAWPSKDHSSRFSPSYIYNQVKLSNDCMSGAYISEGLNILRSSGAALFEDFVYKPDDCARLPDPSIHGRAAEFGIAAWNKVNYKDPLAVKEHLAASFPVVIGMIIDDEFHAMRHGDIYRASGSGNRSGHALVVVGYDNERNAFKVINSWGTDWGDDGFGWIDYAAFDKQVREAYVAQDIIVHRPQPQPDPEAESEVLPPPEVNYSGWDPAELESFRGICLADRVVDGVQVSKRLDCEYGGCVYRHENRFADGNMAFLEVEFVLRDIERIWSLRPTYTSVNLQCKESGCISLSQKSANSNALMREFRGMLALPELSRRCADMLVGVFR